MLSCQLLQNHLLRSQICIGLESQFGLCSHGIQASVMAHQFCAALLGCSTSTTPVAQVFRLSPAAWAAAADGFRHQSPRRGALTRNRVRAATELQLVDLILVLSLASKDPRPWPRTTGHALARSSDRPSPRAGPGFRSARTAQLVRSNSGTNGSGSPWRSKLWRMYSPSETSWVIVRSPGANE